MIQTEAISSEEAPTAGAGERGLPSTAAALSDANDLRGLYFRGLLEGTPTRVLVALAVLAAGAGVATLSTPTLGLVAAILTLLVSVGVVFAIADARAADSFFAAYAQQRGLALGGKAPLPTATPLLRKGDKRYAERTLTGPLGDSAEGTLALYTYEETTSNGEGSSQTSYYRYTVGLTEVPECTDHLPELYCQRKSGLRSLERFEDVFRRSKQRVKLESEALDERYEIFAGKGQDPVWLRQLLSPTFIVWLTESAPKKFAFELVNGTLCCYVSGHKEDAEDLDALAAATTAIGGRLRGKSPR